MRASDIVESMPTVGLDDDLLSAIREILRRGLPGLIAADQHGSVVGCLSMVDLVGVALPGYLRDTPTLARAIDEGYADRLAAGLAGTRVSEAIGEAARTAPVVRPEATAVELAEIIVRHRSAVVLVRGDDGHARGVVTADRLLAALVAQAEGTPQ
jgi:CBS domain-containing protein